MKEKRNFKQLSNLEHVRSRTGMWLGQNSISIFQKHFFKKQMNGNYVVEHKEIEEIPAKLKCLDEACMNSIDEYNRNKIDKKIKVSAKMNELKVSLSKDQRRIKIRDNGRGIPARNAEKVFLHLMYGENFEDEIKKEYIAGQNGVGISLVRIVSKYFSVETYNQGICYKKLFTISEEFLSLLDKLKIPSKVKDLYIKTFEETGKIYNYLKLSSQEKGKITRIAKKTKMIASTEECDLKLHGTSVEFELDAQYFNDLNVIFNVEITKQYLQDIAMNNVNLQVIFSYNNEEEIFKFKKGIEEIIDSNEENYYKILYENKENHLIIESFVVGSSNKSLSWVNSNFASLGGSAVEYLENRICDEVRKRHSIVSFEKKIKLVASRKDVRNCFHCYHKFSIVNPRFKSQDKSYLINDLNEDIRKAIENHLDKMIKKLDLINKIKIEMQKRADIKSLNTAEKQFKKLNRTIIQKFIPCASRSKKEIKTLFIGEGDSAIAGIRPVRDPMKHGLFPLRGKPLNVRNLPFHKAIENEEIKNIIAILGLPFYQEKKIRCLEELSFQRIAIITDADYDGYAIRSLMLSFFFEYWPELFNLGVIFITEAPLYEVFIESKKIKKEEVVYCINDEDYYKLIQECKEKEIKITRKKRNKGLGETSKNAMNYAIQNGMIQISAKHYQDCFNIQNLWFHKELAENRRNEIANYSQLFFEE